MKCGDMMKIPNCPNCRQKMLEIVYGRPSIETMEKAERGEVYLGGCMISYRNPKYHCNNCRRSYFKKLKSYIEEPNNWEDE